MCVTVEFTRVRNCLHAHKRNSLCEQVENTSRDEEGTRGEPEYGRKQGPVLEATVRTKRDLASHTGPSAGTGPTTPIRAPGWASSPRASERDAGRREPHTRLAHVQETRAANRNRIFFSFSAYTYIIIYIYLYVPSCSVSVVTSADIGIYILLIWIPNSFRLCTHPRSSQRVPFKSCHLIPFISCK